MADEERPPELPWISISPEIMSHAVWLYHRFGVRFRDAADLLAQHGLTVSDDAIRLWCLDFDSADARRLTRRQGRLGDIWHRDKVFVRYGSVDATLVDRPPRGWARASREPAMLGTNNGRRPQLDTTVRSHQRGIGRHRPTDAVAACPKHVGVQGESCLQPQRLADTPQRVGVVGLVDQPSERRSSGDRSGSSARILLALSAARRRRLTCLMEQDTDVINVRPRMVRKSGRG